MYSLVSLVLHDFHRFDAVLAAWREAGAPAITILDSVGTRELDEQARRDDLPLLPSIRDLLQADDAPRKTLFSVVEDSVVDKLIAATEEIVGDLADEHQGILMVTKLTKVVGFRGP